MGLSDIEVVIIDHLSKEEIRLAQLALNRIQETGDWDLDKLSLELEELKVAGLDIGAAAKVRGLRVWRCAVRRGCFATA